MPRTSTEEIVRPQADETVGTEFLGGYYEPVPCFYAEQMPKRRRERIDGDMRGSANDETVLKANILAVPLADSYDVWVNKKNDLRWAIHDIEHLEEYRNVPIVLRVGMRLLPFTHPVYKIAMP